MLMTVVDRFTKGVHLVPTHKSLTAEGAAQLLFDHVYRHHGLPDSIVSDHDKLFTGMFFPALQKLLGTKQRMSTGYHPETDGQTERANRVLQEVLRHVSSPALCRTTRTRSLRLWSWPSTQPHAEAWVKASPRSC